MPIRNYNPRFRDKQLTINFLLHHRRNKWCHRRCTHDFLVKKRHPFVDKQTLYIYTWECIFMHSQSAALSRALALQGS